MLLFQANRLPLLAALDALVEVSHALLDVTIVHVLHNDLLPAPGDDLVADFSEQTLHSFLGVVVLAQLPDDSHRKQYLGDQLRDLSWLRLLDLSAGFL